MKLKDIAIYVKDRVEIEKLSLHNYISTENMLPEKGGVQTASSLPSISMTSGFRKDDILTSNIRPYFKKIWIANKEGGCSNDVLVLRAKNNCHPKFLYYVLSENRFFDYSTASAKGTKMPRGDKSAIMEYKVPDYCVPEQIQIADILSSLDDKIAFNKRINDNLEQQAQALFKSWETSLQINDCETVKLESIANFISGYSYKGTELVENSKMAMSTIKNFNRNGGFKLDGYKKISPIKTIKKEQYAELFDLLVAHTDLTQNAEVIGNAELVLNKDVFSDIIFSMDLVKVLPRTCFPYRFVLAAMLRTPEFKAHCLGYVNGSTVLHMSKKALPEYLVTKPIKNKGIETIDNILSNYYRRMSQILSENQNLEKLRDKLLPKLMSGELKISDLNN